MLIGVVGPCAAGKTTLANALNGLGYRARDIAQEHSGVQAMWQQITHPDLLIYLDVSLSTLHARLRVDWEQAYLDEMNRRLTHARAHAHFYVDTNALSDEQVLSRVFEFLESPAFRRLLP
jgi:deoxyadenosine/deoxycytidine kinase